MSKKKLLLKDISQGRATIAAAQKARWAKVKGIAEVPKKRIMSASARRKIAAAQRAKWAKARRGKKLVQSLARAELSQRRCHEGAADHVRPRNTG
jgi:hypothetical protein